MTTDQLNRLPTNTYIELTIDKCWIPKGCWSKRFLSSCCLIERDRGSMSIEQERDTNRLRIDHLTEYDNLSYSYLPYATRAL